MMQKVWLLAAGCWLLCTGPASAQMTNGTYTLIQDVVSAAGGQIGGGNPMQATTALGLPAGGASGNGSLSLVGGLASFGAATSGLTEAAITVRGTVDDPATVVTINGQAAAVDAAGAFTATLMLPYGPNTLTAMARDAAGNLATQTTTITLDLPPERKLVRFDYAVTGTVDDLAATVTVNGVAAAVDAGGGFSARVPLTTGLNTLTATATDAAGNSLTAARKVFVPLPSVPPAMPTVGTNGFNLPRLASGSTVTVGGTKTAGTSIWINGQQVSAPDGTTAWSATITLSEGDNVLRIVAKDPSGGASAEAVRTIILDQLPPVITPTAPPKTNFNPFTFTGTVDDSDTVVRVNGVQASRSGLAFEASLPLTLGSNPVRIEAMSPNNYVSTTSVTMTLGTIPTIQSVQPSDGTILYIQVASVVQISATDQESDAMQYRLLVDNATARDWNRSSSASWTPGAAEAGLHTLTVEVRDDYGGSRTQNLEVFVVRQPVQHP